VIRPELELVEGFYDYLACQRFLDYFLNQHQWPDNEYEYAGRRFVLPRLQTWHADPGIRYSYSNNLLITRPWTGILSEIKGHVENRLQQKFNSVLVNYYRHGEDYVGWHADDEPELGESPCIASVSFGVARVFCCRHKQTGQTERLLLSNGSLLIMPPDFQRYWLHSVPVEPSLTQPRFNLTFRNVVEPGMSFT
jgi:alkylated DNA repair dioxygenase AlkB